MNLFAWSIPFMAEKVTEIFYNMIQPNDEFEEEELDIELAAKRKIIEELLEQQKIMR